ncbi:unnamed protein product [Adineta steineri]|uniref:type I protein arginine methyltransferase n=1 Tax=Adineta steineri TaxID=433720 RepID=A0A819EIJ1_9BILA|nr:unnamed protein product [Adineta steineri]CAF3850089.1 unnamed protein product [Adineta steineri]CAF3974861.1 unnamed protein product [Adineta steineri]
MHEYSDVEVIPLDGPQSKDRKETKNTLSIKKNSEKSYSILVKGDSSNVPAISVDESVEHIRSGSTGIIISLPKQKHLSYLVKFSSSEDALNFNKVVGLIKSGKDFDDNGNSQFNERTEDASAEQYFQFYGYLSQQQNMMQDYIRTSTYQRAILDNSVDFAGKVVLDVGAGSGILSFFAAQAGARKVYAVEASTMAEHAKVLIENNHLSNRIQIVPGKIEEIELPEMVDVIISEPMGYMLYNERMLESYIHAKKFLKPNGKMFPTTGDLYVTPFTDEALFMEQVGKANFWYQQSFYGVDLTTLRDAAIDEYFKQPIVDNFDVRICLAKPIKYTVDFLKAAEEDLYEMNIPVSFEMTTTAVVHGLAFWFDVSFDGTSSQVWLSTAPTQPLTHWYQVRCLFVKPLTVNQGQTISGHTILKANRKQSYDVEMRLEIEGTNISVENILDLKNPYFRYPNAPVQVPPGQFHESPTEQYWNGLPNETGAGVHPNANPYSQNCNINNNLNSSGDYDGSLLNNIASTFQPNAHRYPLPFIPPSSNHSDKSNTFSSINSQIPNGFNSFTGVTNANLISQQSNKKT